MFIDENTSRADLIKCWHEDLDDMGDMVDAMIEAGVDPDKDDTPTEAIRAVIIQWIEDGDECGAA